jgi:hypothetical protein
MMTSNGQPERGPRKLPDPALCRAQSLACSTLAECLAESPSACKYVMPFGWSMFCNHPQRAEIVARTEAEKAKKGQ